MLGFSSLAFPRSPAEGSVPPFPRTKIPRHAPAAAQRAVLRRTERCQHGTAGRDPRGA